MSFTRPDDPVTELTKMEHFTLEIYKTLRSKPLHGDDADTAIYLAKKAIREASMIMALLNTRDQVEIPS